MSMARDNWERLVAAVVKRDQIWQLCHAPSISTLSSDTLSHLSDSILSFDDLSASLPSPADLPSFPQAILIFGEEINEAIEGAEIFKSECAEVGEQVERLCQMLRTVNEIAVSTSLNATFYDRPLNSIATNVFGCLEKSLTFVKKCRPCNPLRRIVTIVSISDFRRMINLLVSSVADMTWVLSIYDAGGAGGDIVLSLPPINSNDPIITWVWWFICSLYMGQLQDKIKAANVIASLARDYDRSKRIIVEEGGISPLVKLLKDGSSTEGQIAAASALYTLANDTERVYLIRPKPLSNKVNTPLGDSVMKVQIRVANLVAKMAEHCPLAQEDFARENVIRPLVTLLSYELLIDDSKLKIGKQSIHSLVQINKEERENEKPEVKLQLKISCAKALWMLAKGSISNSRRITETKGLLCLAKLVETEDRELQYNCLMTIMEITAAAESNADPGWKTFKTNAPAAKAVVDQLLTLIKDSDDPRLRIAAIRAIGSLGMVKALEGVDQHPELKQQITEALYHLSLSNFTSVYLQSDENM